MATQDHHTPTLPTTPTRTEADAIVEVAQRAAQAQALISDVTGGVALLALPGGVATEIVDLREYATRPHRKANTVTLDDSDSFAAYVNRHKGAGTTIYASQQRGRVVAILNDHEGTAERPGWGDHRATLALHHTPEWLRWLALDGKLLTQQAFAAHIEASLAEIVEPKAATMLELAETMTGDIAVKWKAGGRLQDGSRQLQYEETVTTRAGETGDIKIPAEFVVLLHPYEGLDETGYKLTARFRYRIASGVLSLGYVLVRPDDVLRDAFGGLVEAIRQETNVPVLLGNYAS